jgi:hypothetical protein
LQTLGGNYLIAFVLLSLPAILVGWRRLPDDLRRLAVLALPPGIVGFTVVSAVTSAGMERASGVVGLAPLAIVCVMWWTSEVQRVRSAPLRVAAVLTLLLAIFALLFGSSFKDGSPLTLHHTIGSGAYAGVTTGDEKARRVSATEALAARWVRRSTGVLFFGKPAGYLMQRGVMVTNAVWLTVGPGDQATVDYFDRTGRWPDIAFVPSVLLTPSGAVSSRAGADPLLFALVSHYTVAETSDVAGLTVLRRIRSYGRHAPA